jgi:hypothetical protein
VRKILYVIEADQIGAKVISHGRNTAFQMAEVAIPQQMFREILQLIAELRPKPPPAPAEPADSDAFKGQPTGGMRPDAEENPTLRPQEDRSGTGLQATGHQQGRSSRQAEKTATIRPKFRVHLGNSG